MIEGAVLADGGAVATFLGRDSATVVLAALLGAGIATGLCVPFTLWWTARSRKRECPPGAALASAPMTSASTSPAAHLDPQVPELLDDFLVQMESRVTRFESLLAEARRREGPGILDSETPEASRPPVPRESDSNVPTPSVPASEAPTLFDDVAIVCAADLTDSPETAFDRFFRKSEGGPAPWLRLDEEHDISCVSAQDRERVLRLARLGKKPEAIAGWVGLLRGEVDLILRLHESAERNHAM